MSKELEALKELKHWKETNNENGAVWLPLFAVENIEEALQELQVIKSASPSEVMECFYRVWNDINAHNNYRQSFEDLTNIKNYILKAQDREKIINELKTLVKCADLSKQGIISLAVLKNALKEVL